MTQPKYDRAQLEDLVLQMMETELGGEKIYRAAIATAVKCLYLSCHTTLI